MSKFPKIVLASKSPGRAKILNQIGIPFESIPSNIDETDNCADPTLFVRNLSLKKAQTVYYKLLNLRASESIAIIACDTVVINPSGEIVGKPKDRKEAELMLKQFSNKTHIVLSGCTILTTPNMIKYQKTITTEVTFRKLSKTEILFYLDNEKWMLRAGGYAIQGLGALLIDHIQGDYYNVVGLPISWIWQILISHYGKKIIEMVRDKES
jgi:septum formation protein